MCHCWHCIPKARQEGGKEICMDSQVPDDWASLRHLESVAHRRIEITFPQQDLGPAVMMLPVVYRARGR